MVLRLSDVNTDYIVLKIKEDVNLTNIYDDIKSIYLINSLTLKMPQKKVVRGNKYIRMPS